MLNKIQRRTAQWQEELVHIVERQSARRQLNVNFVECLLHIGLLCLRLLYIRLLRRLLSGQRSSTKFTFSCRRADWRSTIWTSSSNDESFQLKNHVRIV